MSLIWMLRNLPVLAAGVCLAGLVLTGVRLAHEKKRLIVELSQLQGQLSMAQGELERAQETARVHRAHLSRAAQERRHWSLIINDVQLQEGQDAPLSPLLSFTAERLYPTSP